MILTKIARGGWAGSHLYVAFLLNLIANFFLQKSIQPKKLAPFVVVKIFVCSRFAALEASALWSTDGLQHEGSRLMSRPIIGQQNDPQFAGSVSIDSCCKKTT